MSILLITAGAYFGLGPDAPAAKFVVAHRGASAYAPEHTRAAYELAIRQAADYIEPDLAVSKDGVLVSIHDDTLDRTTDVESRFPDRSRSVDIDGRTERRWFVSDFTLAELRTLDAGSWHSPRFGGERILTFEEVLDVAAAGRVGVVPELKSPARYRDLGHDPVALFAAVLARRQLTGGSPATRVIAQTFDEPAARALARVLPEVPRVLLIEARNGDARLTDAGLAAIRAYATGIGPHKSLIDGRPDIVRRARSRGLTVIPWTFRSSSTGRFPDVTSEMKYYLEVIDVDGLFTDNPDLFPRPSTRRVY